MIIIEGPSLFCHQWRVWIEDRFGVETRVEYRDSREAALDQAHIWRTTLHERGLTIREPEAA